jgi:hypothetical protein
MAEEVKVAEFHLTAPKFIQQVGDSEPKYVDASPMSPKRVRLPAKVFRPVSKGSKDGDWVPQPESAFMTRLEPAAPKKVLPDLRKDPIRKSHEAVEVSGEAKAEK